MPATNQSRARIQKYMRKLTARKITPARAKAIAKQFNQKFYERGEIRPYTNAQKEAILRKHVRTRGELLSRSYTHNEKKMVRRAKGKEIPPHKILARVTSRSRKVARKQITKDKSLWENDQKYEFDQRATNAARLEADNPLFKKANQLLNQLEENDYRGNFEPGVSIATLRELTQRMLNRTLTEEQYREWKKILKVK